MKNGSIKLIKEGIKVLSSTWPPYSRLILAGDGGGWSLDWDIHELRQVATSLGIKTQGRIWKHTASHQSLFFASAQTISNNDDWIHLPHRIGFSYPQGVPVVPNSEPDPVFLALCQHHDRIQRVQVTHTAMYKFVMQSGIDPDKVFQIPLGINLSFFRFRDHELRQRQRTQLGIPEKAFVIGSFQKDGTGWGDGLEPKLVKGPDTLLYTLEKLKTSIPELFVLLVGPARGFVKAGLERLNIPYLHLTQRPYPEVGRLFQVLDLYLVTSRQEGGPKAVLESMASGVPLVTTSVGQAIDLVKHEQNGWMVAVDDVDSLAHWALHVYQNQGPLLDPVIQQGRITAQANAYSAQLPLWRDFMKGFVEWNT